MIDGFRAIVYDILAPHLRRIEFQVARDFVELHFESETRLRCTVSALGSARWLVRKDAHAFEFVRRDFVRHGLQRAGVICGRDAVRSVRAAVKNRFEMQCSDLPVALDAGLDPHQNRMTTAMRVKNLFTRQREFHGATGQHRKFACDNFVRERVGLAAESAADRRGDHANMSARNLQCFFERAMNIVGRLRRAVKREPTIRRKISNARMFFHRQMCVAFVEKHVLAHVLGSFESRLKIAEFERDKFVDIVMIGVRVNLRKFFVERVAHGHDGRERFVRDVNQLKRALGGLFVNRRDRRDRIADEADVIHA